jgi:activator of HSP90 ATPase
MNKNSFKVSTILPANPERIYQDWLSSEGHTAFTGSPAMVEPVIGGKFTAWDGYISGKTLELTPGRRIVQAWRTTEFPADSPDSRVEVLLEEEDGGTRITLVHSEIPEGQADEYLQGWEDYYFTPMAEYYSQPTAGDSKR